jgi:hypothetical protein
VYCQYVQGGQQGGADDYICELPIFITRIALSSSPCSQGLGFSVEGLGLRIRAPGFRIQGSGVGVRDAGCRVQGAGCRFEGMC